MARGTWAPGRLMPVSVGPSSQPQMPPACLWHSVLPTATNLQYIIFCDGSNKYLGDSFTVRLCAMFFY